MSIFVTYLGTRLDDSDIFFLNHYFMSLTLQVPLSKSALHYDLKLQFF